MGERGRGNLIRILKIELFLIEFYFVIGCFSHRSERKTGSAVGRIEAQSSNDL